MPVRQVHQLGWKRAVDGVVEGLPRRSRGSPAPGVAFGAPASCHRSYRLPLRGPTMARWVAARLRSAPDWPTGS